jgi:hypothetical protein
MNQNYKLKILEQIENLEDCVGECCCLTMDVEKVLEIVENLKNIING